MIWKQLKLACVFLYPLYSNNTWIDTFANSEDQDEMPHDVAFHQGPHYLLRQKQYSVKEIPYNLEIITCDSSIFIDGPSQVYCFKPEGFFHQCTKGLKPKLTGGPGAPCIPGIPGQPLSPFSPVAPFDPFSPGDPGGPYKVNIKGFSNAKNTCLNM